MKILYKSSQNHVTWIDLDTETSLDRFLDHLSTNWYQQKLVELGAIKVKANLRSSIRSKFS